MALPEPLKMRPSMSSETGVLRMSPKESIGSQNREQTRELADCVLSVNTRCSLEHLHNCLASVDLQNLTTAHCAVGQSEVDDLGETGELDVIQNHKRTIDGTDGSVL
jgi:hypothetical protein